MPAEFSHRRDARSVRYWPKADICWRAPPSRKPVGAVRYSVLSLGTP